jgi:hypothetical protein
MLVRVVAPHFVAGLIVEHDRIVKTAPILKRFTGSRFGWFQIFAGGQKWVLEVI